MSEYLLAIAIGPVQEFIAAARRTRDLWFGSHLLSEISKAAALSVQRQGGRLIFPAPVSSSTELAPDSPLNVANIILAELPGHDPAVVAETAKKAAFARWLDFAKQVKCDFDKVIRDDLWKSQVNDVIEYYAAWVTMTSDYRSDRLRLMRLLGARKNCRDFLPAKGEQGVAKSSLDGLRESVLKMPPWQEGIRRRLRVREGEQLDVIGLVKRTAKGKWPCPSVSRVAADPWIRGVLKKDANAFRELKTACEMLGSGIIHGLDTSESVGHPHYQELAFEGTVLFQSRLHELWEETQEVGETFETSRKKFRGLEAALKTVTNNFGEPNPYLAVLVADGDRMGMALSRLDNADQHRQFSQALARFAEAAKTIVHKAHGVLVYVGGDDVLAFVPSDQCLVCARQLHEVFADLMSHWSTAEAPLTLSVGLAIAHFLENMEDLLSFGRSAEKHAKSPRWDDRTPDGNRQELRDGLSIHLVKRGGEPLAVRSNWSDNLDGRLCELTTWINDSAISSRVAYDLRKTADLYANWPSESVAKAIKGDILSVLKGKRPGGETSAMADFEQHIRDRVFDGPSLQRLSRELLVARQIAVAVRQASARTLAEKVPL